MSQSLSSRIRTVAKRTLRLLIGTDVYTALKYRRLPLRAPDVMERAGGRPCLFIEPHFDDVVLSCGGTLARLRGAGTPVTLVTVCTADPEPDQPLSPLAQEWMGDADSYAARRREGRAAAEALGLEHVELNVKDIVLRDPEVETTADTRVQGTYHPHEDPCYAVLVERLGALFAQHSEAVVCAPLGVGHHRDHMVVHEAVRVAATDGQDVLYYEEYPYAQRGDALRKRLRELGPTFRPTTVDISATLDERVRLTLLYESQWPLIFGTEEQVRHQIGSYAHRVGMGGGPRERFWVPA